MALLTITPAHVLLVRGSRKAAVAGVALAAGDAFYFDPTTRLALLADAAADPEPRRVDGIALNTAAAGQPVFYADAGRVKIVTGAIGGGIVFGTPVFLSDTPGKLADAITAGTDTVFVGVLSVAVNTFLDLAIFNSAIVFD